MFIPSRKIYIRNEKMMGLKHGMKVTLFRTAESYENGWHNTWSVHMTSYVSRSDLEVGSIDDGGYGIQLIPGGGYRYPYFCMNLHKVTKDDISR